MHRNRAWPIRSKQPGAPARHSGGGREGSTGRLSFKGAFGSTAQGFVSTLSGSLTTNSGEGAMGLLFLAGEKCTTASVQFIDLQRLGPCVCTATVPAKLAAGILPLSCVRSAWR